MHVNNDFQRNSNISNIFATVWRSKEISRIDIAKKLNSYRSTVSNIMNTLLQNNVILEGETGSSAEKGGRKPVFLSVNKNYGCVIGIEIQRSFYSVCAVAFNGETVYTCTGNNFIDKAFFDEPEKLFVSMTDFIMNEIYDDIRKLELNVIGISLGIPGIINTDEGKIIRSDPFNLTDFDYAVKLGNRYGVPLFVENDAKCCGWLHLAENKVVTEKDFLCVLARNYGNDLSVEWPAEYQKGNGIGVGISIAMNGRIVNGHNFAVGEYISRSWKGTKEGQTGLPEAVLRTINEVEDSYREWIVDLFSTLTVFVPLLEPCEIFFHGQENSRLQLIEETLSKEVSQFDCALKKCGCVFNVAQENKTEIAQGAALMVYQRLMEIPSIDEIDSYSHLDWNTVFEVREKNGFRIA